jgi:cell division protein FtsA
VEREAVLVGIDVGTSKVCALIGEVSRDGRLTIMGHGTVPASGLKKGVVVNIDQTVRSIADAVERAERLSGWKIDRAFVGVGGQHVESLNSTGQVAVTAHHREVTREDINRAIEVARAVSIPSNRDVLHVERRGFTVDGQEGVKDPLGMSALRLEVEAHIVSASATAVQNLSKCVQLAGVKIDELVADGLASAESVLTETEKELGVAVADIGAGTIDLVLFADGSPLHTAVLPVGGNNVTNDIAIGVKTTLQVAEELKVRHGTCDLRNLEDEEIAVAVVGDDAGRTISRTELCQIIEARMRETFELLRGEMSRSGHGMLPAGIILTGGAAQLAGTAELGREVLQMPVRVAGPSGIGGLVDTIQDPSYSTAVGLLHWGAIQVTLEEPARYESAPGGGGLGRIRDAIRSIFP